MSQHDYLGIRGKWISRIQEYDLEIKPTSKIKGQGFAKMLTEENERALDVGKKKDTKISLEIHEDLQHHEWSKDIVFYLKNLSHLDHLKVHKKRALRLKAVKYCLNQEGLEWRNPKGLILGYVDEVEAQRLIEEVHNGFCGGHCVARTIAH